MFSFAIYRAAVSISARTRLNDRPSLTAILIHENIFYFCVVSWVLIFNNLMVIVSIYYNWFNIIFKLTSQLTCSKGKTNIPWFGFGSVKLYMHLIHVTHHVKIYIEARSMPLSESQHVGCSCIYENLQPTNLWIRLILHMRLMLKMPTAAQWCS